MNSRQWKQLAHVARKLGIQIEKPAETRSQQHTGRTSALSPNEDETFVKQVVSRGWKLLVVFLTVLGGITAINSLRYDVSIDSNASLNPKDPLETRFVLTNEGPFSIYSVRYQCEFPSMYVPNASRNINNFGLEIVDYEEPEMKARGKVSLRCQHYIPLVDGSILEIRVSYRPSFWPGRIEGGGAFLLKLDSQGNAVWLPIGRLKSLAELKKGG